MIPDIPVVSLPNDSLRLIYSYLDWEDFLKCCSVSTQWENVGKEPLFLKYQIYCKQTFNPKWWNDHFADLIHSNREAKLSSYYRNIALEESSSEIAYQSLSNEIGKLFISPCPIFPGKKWGETHDVIWIPANVTVWKIIYLFLDKGFLKRNNIISAKLDLKSSTKPTWIAMTKCLTSKGGYNTILNQQNKICQFQSNYQLPRILEALIWNYIRFLKQKRTIHNIVCKEEAFNYCHVLELFNYQNRRGVSVSTPYLDVRIYQCIASKKL